MNKHSYKDLIVWKKSADLAVLIYEVTDSFPKNEQYGLTNQMRRAAVSIPSNIAEGKLRGSIQEWKRFLNIAYGSAGELETQLEIASRIGFLNGKKQTEIEGLLQEVLKMLNVLTGPSSNTYRLSANASSYGSA